MEHALNSASQQVSKINNWFITLFVLAGFLFNIDMAVGQGSRDVPWGHSLAICQSGSIVGFGRNDNCQIGDGSGTTTSYEYPYQVNDITNAVSVAVGKSHSLALLDNGTVMAWGRNQDGESGQSGSSDICEPVAVDLPGCAVAISAGNSFSLVLLADGSVWAWGKNDFGQLGNGTSGSSTHIPDSVLGNVTNAIAISAGESHAMALLANGTVKVWGFGTNGQMGNGTNSSVNDTAVTASGSGFSSIVQIDAGDYHCVTRKSNGDIYVWGYNLKGQLGRGYPYYTTSSNIPVKSSGLSGSTSIDIAAGVNFTIVLKSNGTTKATGFNSNRELGNCSYTLDNYTTPISGPTLTNCLDICTPSTASHTLAIMSNGDLKGWGDDSKDQLGVVTSAPHHSCTPVLINDPYIVWEEPAGFYCPVKPSEDNHPQPCCVAVEEGERTKLVGTYASGSVINYSGQDLAITGPITLTSGNHYLTDCDVVCTSDASITINSGARLYIQSGSHLYACDEMWQGIDAKTGSRIYFQSSSIIEDAETAIDVEYGALYTINTAIFNKNKTHFYKHMPSGAVGGLTGDYVISKSKFLCQTTASIPFPVAPVYTTLNAPHTGQRTETALLAVGVPKLLVGNTSSTNANTIDNCEWGVFDWTVKRVQVMHDTLRNIGNGGVYAVYGPGLGGETIDINNNTFNKMPYPIFCYDNRPTARTHIKSNTIDFAGMVSPPQVMTGITYQEITPASGYDPVNPLNSQYNYVDITNNNIYNAPCGIQLVNLTGDQTAPTAKLYVGENYITHSKIPNDAQAGIKTANVRKGVFKANEVKHPSNNVNWWETGMRLSDGYGNALTCNNTHHVGRGVFLDGSQTPDTRLIQNTMEANQIGLFLNWSVIGAQGASGDPRDNVWLGTSWTNSDPNTHVEGTDGTLSPFYVRSSYPYNPQYNTNAGGSPFPITINTTSGSWGGGCIYTSGASFKTDGALDDGTQDLSALLQLQEPETDRERSLHYLAQYNLFDRLVSDVELITANSEFETFVSEHASDNMGKLHQLVAGFRSARTSGADLENGMNLLQTIQPENSVEQTLKDVFSILYGNATDLSSIDGDGEKRLREIAELCPLDYGFGVHTARAALLKLDTLPKNYVSDCEQVPSPKEISEKRGIEESNIQFAVYPNPNSGAFTLSYHLDEFESGIVNVYDLIGKKVIAQSLNYNTSKTEMTLTDLNSGVYILQVDVSGENRFSERVSILKQ